MSRLSCFFAIYTDGVIPGGVLAPPGLDVVLTELSEVVRPGADDELFGPHATGFSRAKASRCVLLGITRDGSGRASRFFADARQVLLQVVRGLSGWGLDVLRLWPFPLDRVDEVLPEEPMAEDLFSVGFTEMGEHGFRAETFGLAKLGQRELSFAFHGRGLLEEAALMCGHLADWLLDHGRRVEPGQLMAYGFDQLSFLATEGAAGGPFHGWHPPLIQRLLPPEVFPGVGVLEAVSAGEVGADGRGDLTQALTRALEQRLLLEELDLTGDAPHASNTAEVNGFVRQLQQLVALRVEPSSSRDSGWRLTSTVAGESGERGTATLGDVVRRAPALLRYLALPHGARLEWDAGGGLTMDLSRARHEDDELDGDLDDELS